MLPLVIAMTVANATPRVAESGAQRTALLELYTSEGCSSCPPADRWLAGVNRERVIPLALHVDYWNEIGWVDPFSQAAFSRRQAQLARGGQIYTPETFLDGRELRDRGALDDQLAKLPPPRATIRLEAAGGELRARAESPDGAARLFVAFYRNGLESDVTSGENRGKKLRHEHVVRRLDGPLPLTAREPIPADADGVAAWVEARGEVLQALALPLR
jgi:hypothetical protein